MHRVSVRAAREQLSSLLDRVSMGEEVVITRHGKEVARLVAPAPDPKRSLPSLSGFRGTIKLKGAVMSAAVQKGRNEERY